MQHKAEKKKPKVNKYPFLVKMILTIYLLICIPMIVAQILILHSSYQELSTQNDTYCFTETKNLSSRMFSQISAFRTIALQISTANKTDIKKYLDPNAPESLAISASEELSRYQLSLPMAKHIGIYYIDRKICLDNRF